MGGTIHDTALKREKRMIVNKLPNNLSYQHAVIHLGADSYNIESDAGIAKAIHQDVAVINSDNLNEKYIYSLPGDDIHCGSLVEWMDNKWIVTERDANTTVYTRAKMIQCNHLLRWVGNDKKIYEQWCIVEDGTKYLTGELEDRHFIVTRGDSRISVTIGRNDQTARFGRERRFLIDDTESSMPLAYALTKPLKLYSVFNGEGAYSFVLQEVDTTDDDNRELRIADYYRYFPKTTDVDPQNRVVVDPDTTDMETGRKVWI